MSRAHELDDAVEAALPDAMRLAVVVHDRDADGVREVLQPLATAGDWTGVMALCVALAALTPVDMPYGELIAWTHIADPDQEQLPLGELVVDAAEKYCPSCRQVRATRDFHRDQSRRDGLKYRCRFCCNDANRRADHRNRNGREAAA